MSDGSNDFLSADEIKDRIRNRVWNLTGSAVPQNGTATCCREDSPGLAEHRLNELRRNLRNANSLIKDVGAITPRPRGWKNDVVQFVKKSIGRLLNWLLRPLRQFNSAMLASLSETVHVLEDFQTELKSINSRVEGIEASVIASQSVSSPPTQQEQEHENPQVDPSISEILTRIDVLRRQLEALSKSVRESLGNRTLQR